MKALGSSLFAASIGNGEAMPHRAYRRVNAADLNLREVWFRDAIFHDPELVIGACREAGRIPADEKWLPWAIEYNFGVGPVDVLLVSSHGRPAIVETKLSYNPEKRREVVAQILDYALSLQEATDEDLPALPAHEDAPTHADLHDCLREGRFMLVVAGDALDPRAIRLSQAMLAAHLTTGWDLAMVDLNLYRSAELEPKLLVVSELRGVLAAETRQVVKVQVEGESARARVTVEHLSADISSASRRAKLGSIDEFLARIRDQSPEVQAASRRIVERFAQIDATAGGRLVFGLESATANLYWRSPSGHPRRIFAMRQDGRFRVFLRYLLEEGREDLASTLREVAKPIVTMLPGDKVGTVAVHHENVEAILSVIDAAVIAVK